MVMAKMCPFCADPHPDLHATYSFETGTLIAYVKCTVCGSRGRTITIKTKDVWNAIIPACGDAVLAWNGRVEDKEE